MTWKDIHQVAALANVQDPGPWTLRKLVWRADAIKDEEWQRIAWLCYCMPRFSTKRATPDDFNPRAKGNKQFLSPDQAERQFKKAKDVLPACLSEDEKERRWQEYVNNGKRK